MHRRVILALGGLGLSALLVGLRPMDSSLPAEVMPVSTVPSLAEPVAPSPMLLPAATWPEAVAGLPWELQAITGEGSLLAAVAGRLADGILVAVTRDGGASWRPLPGLPGHRVLGLLQHGDIVHALVAEGRQGLRLFRSGPAGWLAAPALPVAAAGQAWRDASLLDLGDATPAVLLSTSDPVWTALALPEADGWRLGPARPGAVAFDRSVVRGSDGWEWRIDGDGVIQRRAPNGVWRAVADQPADRFDGPSAPIEITRR